VSASTTRGSEAGRPLWQWSATEVVAATTAGQVSCAEVARSVVDRMREANPRLNAVTLDLGDDAVACAAALDDAHARGAEPGPLHGVPVTIKDNVDVRGQRTPNGLPGLAGLIAPDDSPVTRNLLSAGAVLVGRTNTPEVSMRPTTNNPLYGLTLNPWDVRVSSGGSSGGAGVAVLAGFCAIGPWQRHRRLGEDPGPALRRPGAQTDPGPGPGVPAVGGRGAGDGGRADVGSGGAGPHRGRPATRSGRDGRG
jgi:amidase